MTTADPKMRGDQLERGSVIGGYRIDELISRGGMGIVYRATSVERGQAFALKVLAPEMAGDEEFRKRFMREMRIAASLHHPNVVAVRQADEHEGLLFLVMDLVRGTDLGKVIRQSGPIEPRRATDLLAQVASALDAAHDRGLVHRDVKPANVLIALSDGAELAYVTDFGLAKRFDRHPSFTALTKTGVVVGTVDYMSPEQITGRRMDGRADIYALGCVYFEMLTGVAPYGSDKSLVATLFAHVHEPLPPLEDRLAELYPQLGAVIERATAKSPGDRYLTAGEFADDAVQALCGSPRTRPTSHETRRLVSVLCCGLTPAPARSEHSDPDRTRESIDRALAEIRSLISRHGGTVEPSVGDDVIAVFGIPRAREDDALRAVRAAAELRERLSTWAGEGGAALDTRTGVDTGRLLPARAPIAAHGGPVDVAASLRVQAGAGDIILSAETQRLVRDAVYVEQLEPVALAAGSDPVPVFRLKDLDPIAPGHARRFDIPFVGRERELRVLRDAWGRTEEERACHLFTVLGEAGVGKSRLIAALLEDVGRASHVLHGRCLPYGEGITFWPVTEALAPLGDAARPVIGLLRGGVAAPEELFLAVRRLLESLAAERPVVLHVDDLQWAEPMLLDLLDHIADLSRGAPILLLCAARLELLDLRSGWGGGKLNATTALLGPLGASDSEKLLDELSDELDPEMRQRVLIAGDGNPLFLEEMAALARESGSLTVPATIEALLAERLERLASEERQVLECAAVEGEVFHRQAVAALLGARLPSTLESSLSSLVRKELIRAEQPEKDDAFRFRHLLIRDAAYDALPDQTRARLHRQFAGWLEESAHNIAELDEIAGWHLEQAVRYGQALGRRIEPGLARRAAGRLHAAGRRAGDRGDVGAARSLLERAVALAPVAGMPPGVIDVDLAERLVEAGELERADELLSAAELDAGPEPVAALTRFAWMIRVRPEDAMQTIESKLPRILEQLEAINDERGIARAHLVASMPHWVASEWTLAGEQARLAAEHAGKAGDQAVRSRALGIWIGSMLYGQAHVAIIAPELEAIECSEPGARLAVTVELALGQLARLEGRFPDARAFMQRALEGAQSLGMPELEAACNQELGVSELSAGDPTAALPWLLRSDALLADLGQHALRSTTQALIALTKALLNDVRDARAAVELAERLSASEDIHTFAITHRVRAQLALSEKSGEAAVRWARSAVTNAFRSDSLEDQAEATLELGLVLEALGRLGDARSEARTALELSSAKGYRPGIEHARALLDRLEARV